MPAISSSNDWKLCSSWQLTTAFQPAPAGATKSGSRSENIALQGIRNTAQSFTKWLFVYKVSGSGSELETEAIRRMSDLASNTEEWAIVFVVSPSGSETEKKAKEKLGRDMLEAPPAPPDKAEDRPKKKV